MHSEEQLLAGWAKAHGKKEHYYYQVKNDAMRDDKDPLHSIPQGSWIVMRRFANLNSIWWGETFAFRTVDDIVIIRRIYPSEKEGYIKLVSKDPENWPTYDFPLDEIVEGSFSLVEGVAYVNQFVM